MRFEELAYPLDGSPAPVRFNAGLTVMSLSEAARTAWVARLLGVLEGTRAGDSTSAVYTDRRGRRIGLDRDDQGGATLIDLGTGAEVPYSAGALSLDGRFDWFASVGLTSRAASDLIVVDSDAFTGDQKWDPQALEAKLNEARKRLSRAVSQHEAAVARCRRRDELSSQISELDERATREEADRERRRAEAELVPAAAGAADDWWQAMATIDDARRAFGGRTRLDPESLSLALTRPGEVGDDLESLAKACLVMAERRDELVALLDTGATAETRRELIEEVEPAYVDALAALANACRPFGVILDATRIEAVGLGAAGIERLGKEVQTEVAARLTETRDAHLQQALEHAEAECRTAREHLEHHLTGLGLPTGSTDDLVAGAEGVAARARDAASGKVDDSRRTKAERARLVQALQRVERKLTDVAELAERRSALEGQVVELETSLNAGRPLMSADEAEAILRRRATEAGRHDRRREPLPLIVDNALAFFGTTDKTRVLESLAGLAETTQIVYLTDDPDTLSWASRQSEGVLILWRPDDVASVA